MRADGPVRVPDRHGNLNRRVEDLASVGEKLDKFPNMMVDFDARISELGRAPYSARRFFIKYQDRILFGKDAFEPSEYPYYWRVFETSDDYFDCYRDYHAF